jgi:predicted DNA-binding transcriptional regulator YafY
VQADDDLDAADAGRASTPHRLPPEPLPGDAHRLALGPDWKTLAPGPLEDILELAAEAGLCVEILYVNAAGEKKPRTVQPEAVYRQKRRVWLDATERDTDASHTFALDRIAAIRTAPG